MNNQIVLTVGVDGSRVISHAYYRFDHFLYFLISNCVDFNAYEYSKHLFSRMGEKLGEDLFFKSKRNLRC